MNPFMWMRSVNEVDLPVEKVSAALTMMELKGMVQHVGGMRYAAIREMTRK
jgi:predicted Rossmann fold nucleotide-binding protein DprA/Smf involved in DNA uptake